MKKFLFVYHGAWVYTREVKDGWTNWFALIGDSIIDGGSPLGPGREVTPTGTKEASPDISPATGYTLVKADSMEEAVGLLEECPIIDSVMVYEAMSM